jgi:hypothetical protein
MKLLNYVECFLVENFGDRKLLSSEDKVLKFMLWANYSEVSNDMKKKK